MSFWRIVKQTVAAFLDILPTSEFADMNGGYSQTQVNSSGAWDHDISTVPFWVMVSVGNGTPGSYFQYEIAENYGSARVCDIKIWLTSNHSIYKILHIEQTGF